MRLEEFVDCGFHEAEEIFYRLFVLPGIYCVFKSLLIKFFPHGFTIEFAVEICPADLFRAAVFFPDIREPVEDVFKHSAGVIQLFVSCGREIAAVSSAVEYRLWNCVKITA